MFALIALVLSAVGLYAVMAYAVTQRTQEIGVRMALGAGARQVSWLVLRRGLVQLGIGLSLGLAGAYASQPGAGADRGRVSPTDPLTFISITVLLSSRRARRLPDPGASSHTSRSAGGASRLTRCGDLARGMPRRPEAIYS